MPAFPSSRSPSEPPPASRPSTACGRCGWPVDQPSETISRHPTSDGTVVYTRCICGKVNVWLLTPGPSAVQRLVGGRPAGTGSI